jgi:hypothetical protein
MSVPMRRRQLVNAARPFVSEPRNGPRTIAPGAVERLHELYENRLRPGDGGDGYRQVVRSDRERSQGTSSGQPSRRKKSTGLHVEINAIASLSVRSCLCIPGRRYAQVR